MNFLNALLTGLFCMAVVFGVLGMIYAAVRLLSFLLVKLEKTKQKRNGKQPK